MSNWREVKLRRVIALLAICCGGLWLLYAGFAIVEWTVRPWLLARWADQSSQHLNTLPAPLPDTTVATLTGARIDHFGYSIQLPWTQIARDRTHPGMDFISLAGRGGVMLKDPTDPSASLTDMAKQSPAARAELEKLVSARDLQSGYAEMAAELAATPQDVHWWNSRHAHLRSYMLLMQKSMLLMPSVRVHPVAANSIRGFQFGDPSDETIHLILFDAKDRRYEIFLTPGTHPLTQEEINGIIASIHPIP